MTLLQDELDYIVLGLNPNVSSLYYAVRGNLNLPHIDLA